MDRKNLGKVNDGRILLFKPQGELTYIRKLSMSYGYYSALAIVNSNDTVTHVGLDNKFQIIPFKDLNYHYRNLLGNERCKKLYPNDIMSIYKVIRPLKLQRYHLIKECHGMRFALPEEAIKIRLNILECLSRLHNISIDEARQLEEYKELGVDNINIDFNNLEIDKYKSFNDLLTYNEKNAKGQTKLM